MDKLIELMGVNCTVSPEFSLRNVDLTLYSGACHFVVGENASGKSSLINVMSGQYAPDSGTIRFRNADVPLNFFQTMDKKQVAIFPQDPAIFGSMSITENIFCYNPPYTNRLLKTIDHKKLTIRCQALLNEFGLPWHPQTRVGRLDVIQQRVVELLRAYVSRPILVLMDEPAALFTVLDMDIFYRIVRSMCDKGVTVLISSHRLEDIGPMGDYVSVIHQGTIRETFPVARTRDDISRHIIDLLYGDIRTDAYPRLRHSIGQTVFSVRDLCTDRLHNLSFDLHAGEILGVVGLSGSGRTELARSLMGLGSPSGILSYKGLDIDLSAGLGITRRLIGYVPHEKESDGLFQNLGIDKNLTVSYFVGGKKSFWVDSVTERSVAIDYKKRLNINAPSIDTKILHLNSGNQQKVLLGRSFISKPKLFILDEPTQNVDLPTKVDIYNLILEIAQHNIPVLMISSDLDEILGLCDRVIVLRANKQSISFDCRAMARHELLDHLL